MNPRSDKCDVYAFNITTRLWAKLFESKAEGDNYGRFYGHSAVVWKDRFYTVFGTNGFEFTNVIRYLDLQAPSNGWRILYGRPSDGYNNRSEMTEHIPTARYRQGAVVYQNYIVVIGGGQSGNATVHPNNHRSEGISLHEIFFFDLELADILDGEDKELMARCWTKRVIEYDPSDPLYEDLKYPRLHHSVVANGSKIYISGGSWKAGLAEPAKIFESIYELDINVGNRPHFDPKHSKMKIKRIGSLPSGYQYHSSALCPEGATLYFFGGSIEENDKITRQGNLHILRLQPKSLKKLCQFELLKEKSLVYSAFKLRHISQTYLQSIKDNPDTLLYHYRNQNTLDKADFHRLINTNRIYEAWKLCGSQFQTANNQLLNLDVRKEFKKFYNLYAVQQLGQFDDFFKLLLRMPVSDNNVARLHIKRIDECLKRSNNLLQADPDKFQCDLEFLELSKELCSKTKKNRIKIIQNLIKLWKSGKVILYAMDEIGNTALSYLSYDSSKPILDLTESILSHYPYEIFSRNINDETCIAYAFASPRTYNGKDIGFLDFLLSKVQKIFQDENHIPEFNFRLKQWEYSFYIQFRKNPEDMKAALEKAKKAVAKHETSNAERKLEEISIISFDFDIPELMAKIDQQKLMAELAMSEKFHIDKRELIAKNSNYQRILNHPERKFMNIALFYSHQTADNWEGVTRGRQLYSGRIVGEVKLTDEPMKLTNMSGGKNDLRTVRSYFEKAIGLSKAYQNTTKFGESHFVQVTVTEPIFQPESEFSRSEPRQFDHKYFGLKLVDGTFNFKHRVDHRELLLYKTWSTCYPQMLNDAFTSNEIKAISHTNCKFIQGIQALESSPVPQTESETIYHVYSLELGLGCDLQTYYDRYDNEVFAFPRSDGSTITFSEYEIVKRLRWLTEISSALEYLHGRSIYHLDIKPGNIILGVPHIQPNDELDKKEAIEFYNQLFSNDGEAGVDQMFQQNFRAKLIDFGNSKSGHRDELTLKATYFYSSPETIDGLTTSASDVFSFGILAMRSLFDFSQWQRISMQPSVRKTIKHDVLNMFPFYLIQNCTKYEPSNRLTIKQARSLINYEISKDFKNDERYESYVKALIEVGFYVPEGSEKWIAPPMNTSKFDGKVASIPETILISTSKFEKIANDQQVIRTEAYRSGQVTHLLNQAGETNLDAFFAALTNLRSGLIRFFHNEFGFDIGRLLELFHGTGPYSYAKMLLVILFCIAPRTIDGLIPDKVFVEYSTHHQKSTLANVIYKILHGTGLNENEGWRCIPAITKLFEHFGIDIEDVEADVIVSRHHDYDNDEHIQLETFDEVIRRTTLQEVSGSESDETPVGELLWATPIAVSFFSGFENFRGGQPTVSKVGNVIGRDSDGDYSIKDTTGARHEIHKKMGPFLSLINIPRSRESAFPHIENQTVPSTGDLRSDYYIGSIGFTFQFKLKDKGNGMKYYSSVLSKKMLRYFHKNIVMTLKLRVLIYGFLRLEKSSSKAFGINWGLSANQNWLKSREKWLYNEVSKQLAETVYDCKGLFSALLQKLKYTLWNHVQTQEYKMNEDFCDYTVHKDVFESFIFRKVLQVFSGYVIQSSPIAP